MWSFVARRQVVYVVVEKGAHAPLLVSKEGPCLFLPHNTRGRTNIERFCFLNQLMQSLAAPTRSAGGMKAGMLTGCEPKLRSGDVVSELILRQGQCQGARVRGREGNSIFVGC